MDFITPADFHQLDVRVGTVKAAAPFPEARRPALRLTIDFGAELGLRESSAQITRRYRPEDLVGTQVLAVINLPPKRIGPFTSECLVLGLVPSEGDVILIRPEWPAPNGTRLA